MIPILQIRKPIKVTQGESSVPSLTRADTY